MTTQSKLPNYRIYDRTGGGVTQDIFAETLDDAIEAGREWIEDGDWERDEMETPLACCVRPIVRVPDMRSIEALPGVYDVRVLSSGTIHADVDLDSLPEIKKLLAGAASFGVVDGTDGDDKTEATCVVVLAGPMPMMIDDRATMEGETHDCSGVCPAKDAPACADGCEHDWQEPFALVGGIRDNPGCWGSGHGSISQKSCCALCGLYRTVDYGATNPSNGQQATRVSYEDADEASAALSQPKEIKVRIKDNSPNHKFN